MTVQEWMSFSITQEIMMELKRRQADIRDMLLESAGRNPVLDSYRAGAYAALEDVVNFRFDEQEESQ